MTWRPVRRGLGRPPLPLRPSPPLPTTTMPLTPSWLTWRRRAWCAGAVPEPGRRSWCWTCPAIAAATPAGTLTPAATAPPQRVQATAKARKIRRSRQPVRRPRAAAAAAATRSSCRPPAPICGGRCTQAAIAPRASPTPRPPHHRPWTLLGKTGQVETQSAVRVFPPQRRQRRVVVAVAVAMVVMGCLVTGPGRRRVRRRYQCCSRHRHRHRRPFLAPALC